MKNDLYLPDEINIQISITIDVLYCLFVFGNIFRTIAIKQLSHLVSPGSKFSILTNLFKCVQNVNKPSVSN